MSYSITVRRGTSNTVYIPVTGATSAWDGTFRIAAGSDGPYSTTIGTVSFDTDRAIINLSSIDLANSNFPGTYQLFHDSTLVQFGTVSVIEPPPSTGGGGSGTGDVTSEDLQAAVDSLSSAISEKAASSTVTAHTSATALVHGATGAVVGTTNTQTLTNKTLTAPVVNSPTGIVKADVGLSNVDNTSDATKNSATATLTNKTLTSPVINSPTGIVKANVGLGSVDNTSDASKPVSTATQTALDGKQDIDSDLTAIAAIAPTNDDVIQRKAGAWTNRTMAQVKTDLSLAKADVGLSNVDNTSDATKNAATATLTNKTLTAPVINSPTGITKANVGLGNVDNTADANKPISTPVQDALDLKANAADVITSSALTDHVNATAAHGATGAVVGTTNTQTLTNKTLTAPVVNSPTGIVKADVGLSNVNNTSDAAKPVSTATQTALDLKANTADIVTISNLTDHEADTTTHGATGAVVGTTNTQTLTNKTLTSPVVNTPTGIVKGDVGLGNVDNTADANKPVSTPQQDALDLKLDIADGVSSTDLTTHTGATAAHGATGAIVGTTNAQTLTNKTLTSPVVNTPTGIVKGDVGLGSVDNTSDATKNAATATLTNKTLTSPVINTPTGIVKGDVGLGNVDNTSDATKNAASVTLSNKVLAFPSVTGTASFAGSTSGTATLQAPAIAGTSALTLPAATDTLVGKATTDTLTNKTLTSPVINTPTGIVKGDVGLGNVDNTSDATKNAASVTLTNKTLTSPVINTPTGIVKGDVGLGSVDNTSDASKPVSTATQTALDGKQPIDSDLTAIAAISPSNDDLIQRKSGVWVNRTMAQVKTDLVLVKADVGLGNVDNTSDATKAATTVSAPTILGGTVGAAATFARQDHAHPATLFQADDHGFLGWNGDPATCPGGTLLGTAGTLFVVKLRIPVAATITNLHVYLTANGATLTANQSFAALYTAAGAHCRTTGSQSPAWVAGAGLQTMALSSTYSAAAGDYYIGLWWNGTTAPTFARFAVTAAALHNANLSAAASRFAITNDTGLTTVGTAPSTLGTKTASSSAFWVAVS